MSEIPDNPKECAICQRVEARIKSLDALKGRLSEKEIENLITEVQAAVLKKSNITRGNTMSEDKIVLNKANFDELYEAQKYILLLVEKMANRMEKHDAILAAYGAQLADVMMKTDDLAGLEVAEEDVEPVCEPGCKVSGGEESAPMAPPAPIGGAGPGAGAPIAMGKTKEYEAGYAAAMADITKKNGVPATAGNFKYPEFGTQRPVSAQDAKTAQDSMNKAFSMEDLAKMSVPQMNAELRKRGL